MFSVRVDIPSLTGILIVQPQQDVAQFVTELMDSGLFTDQELYDEHGPRRAYVTNDAPKPIYCVQRGRPWVLVLFGQQPNMRALFMALAISIWNENGWPKNEEMAKIRDNFIDVVLNDYERAYQKSLVAPLSISPFDGLPDTTIRPPSPTPSLIAKMLTARSFTSTTFRSIPKVL